jgi:hypothetical protein
MGSSNVVVYAKWSPYQVRDTGPAGGLIFYDKGAYSSGWRYLEAAPLSTERTGKLWSYATELVGGTGTGIGSGQSNTLLIVTWLRSAPESDRAAQICDDLVYNSYDDWFLPSWDELGLIYSNLKLFSLGGYSSDNYWSSSECSDYFSYYQDFLSGTKAGGSKWYSKSVRAIREF